MGILEAIGFGGNAQLTSNELPEIFPFPLDLVDFIKTDIITLYSRILTDTLQRTHGIKSEDEQALWDNCLAGESNQGLVTLLATAMYEKKDLYLIYDRGTKVIRIADTNEQAKIREEYKSNTTSKIDKAGNGVYITFNKYTISDMMRIYSSLEYYTISSLYKNMNLSKALQMKFNDLRASIGLNDSSLAEKQAKALATQLSKGKDILLDSKDILEMAKPDLTATNASIDFINQKKSFYLGIPSSYVTGLSPKTMGDTGEGEQKAVERGLKNFYFSIIKPVVEALFEVKTTFKTEDFYGLTVALEALKTFEITENSLISIENKLSLVNKLFGLPTDAKGDDPEDPVNDNDLNPTIPNQVTTPQPVEA